jgi:hypothetical protein
MPQPSMLSDTIESLTLDTSIAKRTYFVHVELFFVVWVGDVLFETAWVCWEPSGFQTLANMTGEHVSST